MSSIKIIISASLVMRIKCTTSVLTNFLAYNKCGANDYTLTGIYPSKPFDPDDIGTSRQDGYNYFHARHEIRGGRVSISKERTLYCGIARRKTG